MGYRFRPVRTTNIDVFVKMLEPDPARVVFPGFASEEPSHLGDFIDSTYDPETGAPLLF